MLDPSQIVELKDPEQRKPYEDELARKVRAMIAGLREPYRCDDNAARYKRRTHAALLLKSMQNDWTNRQPGQADYPTFGSWAWQTGRRLGEAGCRKIGMRVCAEMGFTTQEAEQILETTPPADESKMQVPDFYV